MLCVCQRSVQSESNRSASWNATESGRRRRLTEQSHCRSQLRAMTVEKWLLRESKFVQGVCWRRRQVCPRSVALVSHSHLSLLSQLEDEATTPKAHSNSQDQEIGNLRDLLGQLQNENMLHLPSFSNLSAPSTNATPARKPLRSAPSLKHAIPTTRF